MKTILLILGSIILVGLVAAGSFWGGMAYQSSRVDRARANFEAARGPIAMKEFPGEDLVFQPGSPPAEQGAGPFGRGGTTGQVKSVAGNTLQISTAQDVTTAQLSDATQIEKTVIGTPADLQPGTRVVVTGERDSDGNITASRITILNGELPGPGGKAAPGTEP